MACLAWKRDSHWEVSLSPLHMCGDAPGGGRVQRWRQWVTSGRPGLAISGESLAELWLTRSPDSKATTGAPSAQPPGPQEHTPRGFSTTSRKAFLPSQGMWLSSFLSVPFSDDVILIHPMELLDRTQPLVLEDQDERVATHCLVQGLCAGHSDSLCPMSLP